MKKYAYTNEVPKGCSYLTSGKLYKIEPYEYATNLFRITSDSGESIVCAYFNCEFLDGKSWKFI